MPGAVGGCAASNLGMDDIERQAIREEGRDPEDWRVQLGQRWVSLLLQEHARVIGIPPRYPGPLP